MGWSASSMTACSETSIAFARNLLAGNRPSTACVTDWPHLQAYPAQRGSAVCVIYGAQGHHPEFTPSSEEQELSRLVADYLRRPNLKAMPEGQRQLISLVLWKLLASSSHAIAGALETMAKRLQGVLDETAEIPDLAEELDEDYESLDETADEWSDQESASAAPNRSERNAIAREIEELRHFKALATNIRDNAKARRCLLRWIAPSRSWIGWARPERPSSSPSQAHTGVPPQLAS